MIESQVSEVVLVGPNGEPLIPKTPGVCGGDACIKDSRIMVWLLVSMKQAGKTDEAILSRRPGFIGPFGSPGVARPESSKGVARAPDHTLTIEPSHDAPVKEELADLRAAS
jgi:hypothetical protein